MEITKFTGSTLFDSFFLMNIAVNHVVEAGFQRWKDIFGKSHYFENCNKIVLQMIKMARHGFLCILLVVI